MLSDGDEGSLAALAAAAALSSRSNHPVSKAVTACCKAAGGRLPKVDVVDFKLVPGAPAGGRTSSIWSPENRPRALMFGNVRTFADGNF